MTGLQETRTLSNGHRHSEKEIIAYLSYALKDVRKLSPLGAHLLEMSIAVLNDDTRAANKSNNNAGAAAS
jgi:hypothetical protein